MCSEHRSARGEPAYVQSKDYSFVFAQVVSLFCYFFGGRLRQQQRTRQEAVTRAKMSRTMYRSCLIFAHVAGDEATYRLSPAIVVPQCRTSAGVSQIGLVGLGMLKRVVPRGADVFGRRQQLEACSVMLAERHASYCMGSKRNTQDRAFETVPI